MGFKHGNEQFPISRGFSDKRRPFRKGICQPQLGGAEANGFHQTYAETTGSMWGLDIMGFTLWLFNVAMERSTHF